MFMKFTTGINVIKLFCFISVEESKKLVAKAFLSGKPFQRGANVIKLFMSVIYYFTY
jgi:hypothetical protein